MSPKENHYNESETISENLVFNTKMINDYFQKGFEACEVLNLITQYPKPICVDFNEVLVGFDNNEIILNPYAKEFLTELESLVNIFITTSNSDFMHVNLVCGQITWY